MELNALLQSELHECKLKLDTVTTQATQLSSEVTALNVIVSERDSQLSSNAIFITELEGNIHSLEERSSNLVNDVFQGLGAAENWKKKFRTLKSSSEENEKSNTESIKKLRTQIKSLTTVNQENTHIMDKMRRRNESLELSINKFKDSLKLSPDDISLESIRNSEKITELELRVVLLGRRNAALKDIANTAKRANHDRRNLIELAKKESRTAVENAVSKVYTDRLDEAILERYKLVEEKENLQVQVNRLKTLIKSPDGMANVLETDLFSATEKITEMKVEIKTFENKFEKLQADLEISNNHVEICDVTIAALRNEIEQMKSIPCSSNNRLKRKQLDQEDSTISSGLTVDTAKRQRTLSSGSAS
ncbi:hypothetical protein HK096_005337, partial [Nowakowskiella sp. JEL0078]